MLTSNEILEKIHSGENSGVEFKEIYPNTKLQSSRDNFADEIVAFANHQGGLIIFGVTDKTHQIIGIEHSLSKKLIRFIGEICSDSLEPALVDFYVDNIKIPNEMGEEKNLVYMEIGKSLWLHKTRNGFFYRHAESKKPMTTEQILRIGNSRSQARIIYFDEQIVPKTNKETLQKEFYQKFIAENPNDEIDLLLKRRLLVKKNGDYSASVSGLLMCNSKPEDYLYHSFIQAVYYNGKTKDANYQIDAKDFTGTLDRQIVDAFKFVQKHNTVSATKNIGRVEKPQYSMKAVFEAIVNAVVHRDYSKYMSKIRLFMFSDRLEIYSPGALANALTVDNLAYNQISRNPLLSRLLSEITLENDMAMQVNRKYFLERRGEGVGIILGESEALSEKKPTYEMFGEELLLTIFAAESLQKIN